MWWPKLSKATKPLTNSPKEQQNSQNSPRLNQSSPPDKPKLMVFTEHEGARNFQSGGLMGHSSTTFPAVTNDSNRALNHHLEGLRGITLTGIPFDRGKLPLEKFSQRTKRLKQLFQELNLDLKPGHHCTITQASFNRVPKNLQAVYQNGKTQPRDTTSPNIF